MTAKGKITTARLHEGSRIMVRTDAAGPDTAYPSATKAKDARVMVVDGIEVAAATAVSRRRTYHIHGTIDGKPYRIPHATGAQTFWLAPLPQGGRTLGYVALYHSSSTKETMALHRAGCGDIEKDRERHGSNLQAFEATDLEAALNVVIDDELTEMGYDHSHVRVYPCVTSTEPKEGHKMTATATRKRQPASKPAPASARKPATEKVTAKSTPKGGRTRQPVPVPSGFKSWEDPKLVARILKEKAGTKTAKGKTIKEITEGLGLPTDERHAHKVSLVYRAAADAKGTRTTKRTK